MTVLKYQFKVGSLLWKCSVQAEQHVPLGERRALKGFSVEKVGFSAQI